MVLLQWEEWSESSHPTERIEVQTRSRREEKQLWAILNELDKKLYQKERKEQTTKMMGADRTQPSISEKLIGGLARTS